MQSGPHLVCISGEAGLGKTRLAEELLRCTMRQGHATARTRAYALEGRLAYAPLADWLWMSPLQAKLAKLNPLWLSEAARAVYRNCSFNSRIYRLPNPWPNVGSRSSSLKRGATPSRLSRDPCCCCWMICNGATRKRWSGCNICSKQYPKRPCWSSAPSVATRWMTSIRYTTCGVRSCKRAN